MALSDADWIKLRLPPGATFTKNNVSLDIDSAVEEALAANAQVKEAALADLLEVLASKQTHSTEWTPDLSLSGPRLQSMADYWRQRAPSPDGTPAAGGWRSVPLTHDTQPSDVSDEFSS